MRGEGHVFVGWVWLAVRRAICNLLSFENTAIFSFIHSRTPIHTLTQPIFGTSSGSLLLEGKLADWQGTLLASLTHNTTHRKKLTNTRSNMKILTNDNIYQKQLTNTHRTR